MFDVLVTGAVERLALDVAETGAVAAVELLPESRMPAELRPTIAGAIREVFGDGSVTSMFDGAA